MPDHRIFGRTLAALRMAHGWTQEKLAERAGMNKSQISRYERNQDQPGPRNVQRLAEALNLDPVELHLWQKRFQELVERTAPGPPPRPTPPVVDWPFPWSVCRGRRTRTSPRPAPTGPPTRRSSASSACTSTTWRIRGTGRRVHRTVPGHGLVPCRVRFSAPGYGLVR